MSTCPEQSESLDKSADLPTFSVCTGHTLPRVSPIPGFSATLLWGDLILRLGDQDACHAEYLIAAHDRLVRSKKLLVTFLRGGKLMQASLDLSRTQRSFLNVPKKKRRG